jgi:pimeloyl-ACP methyl ester carboxylesterase
MPAMPQATEIYDDFPSQVRPDARYVIYSHGFIVEGDDPRPVHPEFGVYDFPAVKEALFDGGGFNLIAHHRPKGTEFDPYVDKLEAWGRRLVTAGVAPSRVTFVGFSRGGALTAYAASRLRDLGPNSALLAANVGPQMDNDADLVLSGNVLSIYETSDFAGSCAAVAARSKDAAFEEIAISTGLKHGAFYRPHPDWLAPLKDWIARTNR